MAADLHINFRLCYIHNIYLQTKRVYARSHLARSHEYWHRKDFSMSYVPHLQIGINILLITTVFTEFK